MEFKHYATVKVMKEGRITIPIDIRELEDIKEGDYLRIGIDKFKKNNKILKPYTTVQDEEEMMRKGMK